MTLRTDGRTDVLTQALTFCVTGYKSESTKGRNLEEKDFLEIKKYLVHTKINCIFRKPSNSGTPHIRACN